jgi:uncharacterized protein YxjI
MLDRKTFFIKERVGLLKFADTYDILDPESREPIGIAREKPGALIHLLRMLVNKQLLPTRVDIHDDENRPPLLSITRGVTLLRSKIKIINAGGEMIGYFKSKIFSLGGGFHVYDKNDNRIAEVSGDWKGWNFRMKTPEGKEIGTVTKKWAGIGKELFTSADNYMISIADDAPMAGGLLLAAGLAIDTVYKEK